MDELHQTERAVLRALSISQPQKSAEIAKSSGLAHDAVLRAIAWLSQKGLLQTEQRELSECILSPEGERFIREGLPESRVLIHAQANEGLQTLSADEKTIGLAWARKNGWVQIANGLLSLTDEGKAALYERKLERALSQVKEGVPLQKADVATLVARGLAFQKSKAEISARLTHDGEAASRLAATQNDFGEVNQLTKELISSGAWRSAKLRPYDISAPVEEALPGKRHVISRLAQKVRSIFAELGFEEMDGPVVESAFWNFDALFQPQDHPSRELADTFYIEGQSELPPDPSLIKKIADSHKKGWSYDWQEPEARKTVLRTHTTAVSARYLYSQCKGNKLPKKFFSVGKVYRNEATDYKHLAEFFQVEGIVAWESATFGDLLGLLKKFYSKLGFQKIRFRPSYFPYTEPSLEIEVYFGERGWFELGGAGILRPEVSLPLCGRYPVLAWGLSLERPPMLVSNIKDIRTFYRNQIGWLRKSV
jgi:phenylalanyl-tRNA synthetase alpha chain